MIAILLLSNIILKGSCIYILKKYRLVQVLTEYQWCDDNAVLPSQKQLAKHLNTLGCYAARTSTRILEKHDVILNTRCCVLKTFGPTNLLLEEQTESPCVAISQHLLHLQLYPYVTLP